MSKDSARINYEFKFFFTERLTVIISCRKTHDIWEHSFSFNGLIEQFNISPRLINFTQFEAIKNIILLKIRDHSEFEFQGDNLIVTYNTLSVKSLTFKKRSQSLNINKMIMTTNDSSVEIFKTKEAIKKTNIELKTACHSINRNAVSAQRAEFNIFNINQRLNCAERCLGDLQVAHAEIESLKAKNCALTDSIADLYNIVNDLKRQLDESNATRSYSPMNSSLFSNDLIATVTGGSPIPNNPL